MKISAHSVHPDVAKAVAVLKNALASNYHSNDFAFNLSVEGQIVASLGGKDDVTPAMWEDVEAETAKRVVPKAAADEPTPADAPGAEPIE